MPTHLLRTPVALFIYNRPHTTKRVFEAIRRVKPSKLLLVADGPRPERSDDLKMCADARALLEQIDWECDIKKSFSEVNMGCGRRMATGLDWVFQSVDRAIILEDDCVPHPTFFRFCDQLLEKYAHEERIAMISGNNFNKPRRPQPYSYRFSMYPLTWGWASWARAWRRADMQMKQWPRVRDSKRLRDLLDDPWSAAYWKWIFQKSYEGAIDTWDYQWTFSCWMNGAFIVHPSVNLVSNIGFDRTATHTKGPACSRAFYPTRAMTFPLLHPPDMILDANADRQIKRRVHGIYPFGGTSLARIGRLVRRMGTWPLRKRPLANFFSNDVHHPEPPGKKSFIPRDPLETQRHHRRE